MSFGDRDNFHDSDGNNKALNKAVEIPRTTFNVQYSIPVLVDDDSCRLLTSKNDGIRNDVGDGNPRKKYPFNVHFLRRQESKRHLSCRIISAITELPREKPMLAGHTVTYNKRGGSHLPKH